jgi:hypothetical protein
MIEAFNESRCPDCGGFIFRPGPRGGVSQNMECVGCGNRFNVVRCYATLAAFDAGGPKSVLFVERIAREDHGGGRWRDDLFPMVLQ